jgi:hypothetical protein
LVTISFRIGLGSFERRFVFVRPRLAKKYRLDARERVVVQLFSTLRCAAAACVVAGVVNQSINQSIGSDIIGHHRTSSDVGRRTSSDIGRRGGEKIVMTNDLMIHDSWNHPPTRASIDFDRSVDFEG